jgi:hypothetical protein
MDDAVDPAMDVPAVDPSIPEGSTEEGTETPPTE